jgi:hypothetical protein
MQVPTNQSQANDPIFSRIYSLENRITELEKKIKHQYDWVWWVAAAGLLGWFWDDIIRILGSIFKTT